MLPQGKKRNKQRQKENTDPVEVYCRIRKVNDGVETCVRQTSEKIIQLIPPSFKSSSAKEMQYGFKHIFGDEADQREVFEEVALPLVRELLVGKNGLMFSYGVTGSGKTYTMQGDSTKPGLIQQTLDVLFNSLSDTNGQTLLAPKFTFKPDQNTNNFCIQSAVDAMAEKARERDEKAFQMKNDTRRARDADVEFSHRPVLDVSLDDADPECCYAVFVSYIEIYNKNIFDLLNFDPVIESGKKGIASNNLFIRNLNNKCAYVSGVAELEVRNANEALQLFARGQKARKMAATLLNADSSRSHCVFTVRVVQSPMNKAGNEIIPDTDMLAVSQLCLVDLAGSERTKRTHNQGDRLKEAGNINNSLMVLRQCMDALRLNQMGEQATIVPYRDSKLTHLFRSYFEGDGKVRMIVCLNPSSAEYDETTQVLQFAESTQEVQVARAQQVRFDHVALAGRRALAEENKKRKAEEVVEETTTTRHRVSAFIEQTLTFPSFKLSDSSDSLTLPALAQFLEDRIRRHKAMYASLKDQEMAFFDRLRSLVITSREQRRENRYLRNEVEERERTINDLQSRLESQTAICNNLMREFNLTEQEKMDLLNRIGDKDYQSLNQRKKRREYEVNLKQRAKDSAARQQQEMQRQLEATSSTFAHRYNQQETKIRRVVDALTNDDYVTPPNHGSAHATSYSTSATNRTATRVQESTRTRERSRTRAVSPTGLEQHDGTPFVNPRYGLAISTQRTNGKTVEHTSKTRAPVGTRLQPALKKRKSVTKLDFEATKNAAHYLLEHQVADEDGNVETQLYKGDVIPTSGGGRSVIFKDVEVLVQKDPSSFAELRRFHAEREEVLPRDVVAEKCSSGHGQSSPRKPTSQPA